MVIFNNDRRSLVAQPPSIGATLEKLTQFFWENSEKLLTDTFML